MTPRLRRALFLVDPFISFAAVAMGRKTFTSISVTRVSPMSAIRLAECREVTV